MDDILLKEDLIKLKYTLLLSIVILLIILIIYTSIRSVIWFTDQKSIDNQLNEIYETTEITPIEDNEQTELLNKTEKHPTDENNPYWDYIKMNLIDVDLENLKKINPSTRGWIQVNGTNINYPFVQGGDNSYYLNHSFNQKNNGAGWVFMDYRNNVGELDRNTILYAHARKDKSLFGSLKNILTNTWLNDKNNYVVKMSTELENTLWQVFSVYHIPTTNDYIKVNFSSDTEFLEFSKLLLERSEYNFQTEVSETDKIITLSTCYNNDEKVVLHAKLIKIEKK